MIEMFSPMGSRKALPQVSSTSESALFCPLNVSLTIGKRLAVRVEAVNSMALMGRPQESSVRLLGARKLVNF